MLALSTPLGIVLLVLGGVFVVAAAAASSCAAASRASAAPDIPPAMRPGPSDAALETPLLQKLQGWGVLLVAFFVIWIPFNWLSEPSDEPQAGEGAEDRGDRAGQPLGRAVQRGEPAGRRLRALPRARAPRRRDPTCRDRLGTPTRRTSRPSAAVRAPATRSIKSLDRHLHDDRAGPDRRRHAVVEHQVRRARSTTSRSTTSCNYLVFMSSQERPVQGQHLRQPRRRQGGRPRHRRRRRAARQEPARRRRGPPARRGPAPDARAGSAHVPRVPRRMRHDVQGRRASTLMAFTLFVGSVYLMLSLVFGKWMGYLSSRSASRAG